MWVVINVLSVDDVWQWCLEDVAYCSYRTLWFGLGERGYSEQFVQCGGLG